jgi:predicted nucleic acid-binding protein
MKGGPPDKKGKPKYDPKVFSQRHDCLESCTQDPKTEDTLQDSFNHEITAYDSAYLIESEEHGLTLVTDDVKLKCALKLGSKTTQGSP